MQIPSSTFTITLQNGKIYELDAVEMHANLETIETFNDHREYLTRVQNLLDSMHIQVNLAEALVISLKTIDEFAEFKKKLPPSLQSLFTTKSIQQVSTDEPSPSFNCT